MNWKRDCIKECLQRRSGRFRRRRTVNVSGGLRESGDGEEQDEGVGCWHGGRWKGARAAASGEEKKEEEELPKPVSSRGVVVAVA